MAPLEQHSEVLSRSYDAALLDLDGVVYIGRDAVPGAVEALNSISQHSTMRLTYVTNNASRSSSAVAAHLCELGLLVLAADVVTSAQAGAALLAGLVPRGSRVFVLGSRDLMREVENVGLVASQDPQQSHLAVIQGYWPDMPWRMLAQAAGVLAGDVPWVATNMDLTIPTQWGKAPGNGSMVLALAEAVGRMPTAVAGKPEVPLMRASIERARSTRPLVVGDRLDTDMLGATNVGCDSLLVLSGVTSVADLMVTPAHMRPTYVGWDVASLDQSVVGATVTGMSVHVGAWSVEHGRLTGEGDVLDAVRATTVATWHGLMNVDEALLALRSRGVDVG